MSLPDIPVALGEVRIVLTALQAAQELISDAPTPCAAPAPPQVDPPKHEYEDSARALQPRRFVPGYDSLIASVVIGLFMGITVVIRHTMEDGDGPRGLVFLMMVLSAFVISTIGHFMHDTHAVPPQFVCIFVMPTVLAGFLYYRYLPTYVSVPLMVLSTVGMAVFLDWIQSCITHTLVTDYDSDDSF